MPWATVRPFIDHDMRKLCLHPYPNHPKGCPNFGKKEGCPPRAPTIEKTLDLSAMVWAVWNVFDFRSHVEKMRVAHPLWTKRQLECCLYWQPKARGQLKLEIMRHVRAEWNGVPNRLVACPEAQGVNLTETMRQVGIELEWPPVTVALQIVLIGKPV